MSHYRTELNGNSGIECAMSNKCYLGWICTAFIRNYVIGDLFPVFRK